MVDFKVEEFNAIKSKVNTLPPKGIEVLNLYYAEKQLVVLKEILEVLKKDKNDLTLDMCTVEALKQMCINKEIDIKSFKNKEDYIKALS